MKKSVIILFGFILFTSLIFANSTTEKFKIFTVKTKLFAKTDLTQFSFKMKYDPMLFSVKDVTQISNANYVYQNNILTSVDKNLGQIVWSVQDYFGSSMIKKGSVDLILVKFIALSSSNRGGPFVIIENVSAFDSALNNIKFLILGKRSSITLRQLR